MTVCERDHDRNGFLHAALLKTHRNIMHIIRILLEQIRDTSGGIVVFSSLI